eukprot:NODE_1070_length_2621_cov_13.821171.p1 GENE.NODE_1070_length_2621_cov_13.821171~~NODE_1070_length_2621_cov_13.821171.p1  ORF type:complete len:704 (-),score=100.83 NODE_1070_length_2621_cov_13.821171:178-2289(-)
MREVSPKRESLREKERPCIRPNSPGRMPERGWMTAELSFERLADGQSLVRTSPLRGRPLPLPIASPAATSPGATRMPSRGVGTLTEVSASPVPDSTSIAAMAPTARETPEFANTGAGKVNVALGGSLRFTTPEKSDQFAEHARNPTSSSLRFTFERSSQPCDHTSSLPLGGSLRSPTSEKSSPFSSDVALSDNLRCTSEKCSQLSDHTATTAGSSALTESMDDVLARTRELLRVTREGLLPEDFPTVRPIGAICMPQGTSSTFTPVEKPSSSAASEQCGGTCGAGTIASLVSERTSPHANLVKSASLPGISLSSVRKAQEVTIAGKGDACSRARGSSRERSHQGCSAMDEPVSPKIAVPIMGGTHHGGVTLTAKIIAELDEQMEIERSSRAAASDRSSLVRSLQAELGSVQLALTLKRDESLALQQEVLALQGMLRSERARSEEQGTQLRDLTDAAEAAEKKAQRYAAEVMRLTSEDKAEKERLGRELRAAQQRVRELGSANAALEKAHSEVKRELQACELASAGVTQKDMQRLRSELSESASKMVRMGGQLVQRAALVRELESRLEQSDMSVKTLSSEVWQMKQCFEQRCENGAYGPEELARSSTQAHVMEASGLIPHEVWWSQDHGQDLCVRAPLEQERWPDLAPHADACGSTNTSPVTGLHEMPGGSGSSSYSGGTSASGGTGGEYALGDARQPAGHRSG